MLFGKKRPSWAELPRSEKIGPVPNPFCGLYTIYRFVAGEEHLAGSPSVPIEDCPMKDDERLALVEINLMNYREKDLPESALACIRRIFLMFRSCRKNMILRFLYDWDGVCIQTEPVSLSTILRHMDQVSPLMKEFTDSIYMAQGLFIGNWGEMHNSRHMANASLIRLYTKWRECVGEQTLLAVRSPSMWRLLNRSLSAPISWNEGPKVQVGLFNDGIMASDTDFGTYGVLHKSEVSKPDDRMLRPYELSFQQELCRFVPNGGEVVEPNPLNDCERSVETLRMMRVSYLNSEYDPAVFRKWEQEKLRTVKGAWAQISAKEWIISHLGYRFLLRKVQVSPERKAQHYTVQLELENTGFSCCYRPLTVTLRVSDPARTVVRETAIMADTRTWQPGIPISLTGTIDTEAIPEGSAALSLRLYEPAGRMAVTLANAPQPPDEDGFMLLGSISDRNAR